MTQKNYEFRREIRYAVFKLKNLSEEQRQRLYDLGVELGPQNSMKPCVVVEQDWPEYEPTWKAIEKRVKQETCMHKWQPWPVAGEGASCINCGLRDLNYDN